MQSWQSDDIEANGIRHHYTRTGGAKPPVVLAHGFSDDGLCWTPVAEALAADYDVIMVDARGHGLSDAPEEGYNAATQADDLAGVIAALGLRRPAILGHSMGAATTLMLAGAYPDAPRAILLEDPPASWMPGSERARLGNVWLERTRAWITGLKEKTRDELFEAQRAETPGWSDAELGPWADSKLRLHLNVLNRADPPSLDWEGTLRRISCPVLLITGDPSRGALVDEPRAEALRALVAHVAIAKIEEAGHSIRRDQFDRYMEVVRAFLAETTSTDG